jgi:hypothetical protein
LREFIARGPRRSQAPMSAGAFAGAATDDAGRAPYSHSMRDKVPRAFAEPLQNWYKKRSGTGRSRMPRVGVRVNITFLTNGAVFPPNCNALGTLRNAMQEGHPIE